MKRVVIALAGALALTACAGTENKPVAPRLCPADYVKVGNSCLDRKPWSPIQWLEADKFCWRRGGVVAAPDTLLTALKNWPAIFRPGEKTHWAKRNGGVFVVELVESESAGEAEGRRVTPVAGAKRYAVSHAFRCEKHSRSGNSRGADDYEQCNGCIKGAGACSSVVEVLNCLFLTNR